MTGSSYCSVDVDITVLACISKSLLKLCCIINLMPALTAQHLPLLLK